MNRRWAVYLTFCLALAGCSNKDTVLKSESQEESIEENTQGIQDAGNGFLDSDLSDEVLLDETIDPSELVYCAPRMKLTVIQEGEPVEFETEMVYGYFSHMGMFSIFADTEKFLFMQKEETDGKEVYQMILLESSPDEYDSEFRFFEGFRIDEDLSEILEEMRIETKPEQERKDSLGGYSCRLLSGKIGESVWDIILIETADGVLGVSNKYLNTEYAQRYGSYVMAMLETLFIQ